jgi:hypothetical protein
MYASAKYGAEYIDAYRCKHGMKATHNHQQQRNEMYNLHSVYFTPSVDGIAHSLCIAELLRKIRRNSPLQRIIAVQRNNYPQFLCVAPR